MSQNPKTEEYVVCPYDSNHRLLPSRLVVHLIRCSRNYPSTEKVTCPYNITHILSVAEMRTHVASCLSLVTDSNLNPDNLTPGQPQHSNFCVESAEDWDAEPPAPTYDPQAHCEADFIIRNPQGNPPAERRKFRERERRRFIENDKA